MLKVSIDEKEVEGMYLQQLQDHIKKLDSDLLFWNSKELQRRTGMSWNTIQDQFFYKKGFPKYKAGNKWYFPAEETKHFLLTWLSEKKAS